MNPLKTILSINIPLQSRKEAKEEEQRKQKKAEELAEEIKGNIFDTDWQKMLEKITKIY